MKFDEMFLGVIGFVIFFGFLIFLFDSGSDEPIRTPQYDSQQAYDHYEESAQDDQYWQAMGH